LARVFWRVSALVAISCLVVAPGAASAATVQIGGLPGFVYYTASKGERNRVNVRLGGETIRIVDRGARRIRTLEGYEDCAVRGRTVTCPTSLLVVRLRDGDDRIRFTPGGDGGAAPADPLQLQEEYPLGCGFGCNIYLPVKVLGGSGPDVIRGSRGPDYIQPDGGADVVDARGGADEIHVTAGTPGEVWDGGGDADTLFYEYYGEGPSLTIDLGAGTAAAPGDLDVLESFERAHGGPGDDILIGSNASDALYGNGGADLILGRDGADLLVGDALRAKREGGPAAPDPAAANEIVGGPGDDVLDARPSTAGDPPATSRIDCGPGSDREIGDVTGLSDPTCESIVLRDPPMGKPGIEFAEYDVLMPAAPVGQSDAGDPVFRVPCDCSGRIELNRPPAAGAAEAGESYGSAAFSGGGGPATDVTVPLNDAGRAAFASDAPVAVRVTLDERPVVPPFFAFQRVF
jgi:hypothetical protein